MNSRVIWRRFAPLAVIFASTICWGAPNSFPLVKKHCAECHDSDVKKAGLDLTALPFEPGNPQNFAAWVKVFDRVNNGEMPPKKKARPTPPELKSFLKPLESSLLQQDRARIARDGRAVERRLNRYEYEETLRDLFTMPFLEVKDFLPEDAEAFGFNKIGDALDVSHVQMARYLSAADYALHQAMAPQAEKPERKMSRYYTMDERQFYGKINLAGPLNRRTFPLIGLDLQKDMMGEKAKRSTRLTNEVDHEASAMAVVVSTYEPTEIRFGGFRAPVSGRYKLTFSGYSVWMAPDFSGVSKGRRSEPVTIYADTPPRILRKLGSFDFGTEPTQHSLEVWLLAGETIRPDAARFFRSRPPDHKNPLAGKEGMPALAFQWMEVDGPIAEDWPPASHKLLFGDLAMTNRPPLPAVNRRERLPAGVDITSAHPAEDAEKLLRNFMPKAYRRPVQEQDVQRFLALIKKAQSAGHTFTESMLAGYTAVLSSPGFLYLQSRPGKLDDLALADRLSYFLWNTAPDQELRSVAARGELHKPAILRKQTERLLNDERSRRFVDAFLDYWLDLRVIAGTAPDTELYPDYQLDDLLVESMISETQLFFQELLRKDLGVTNLVSSSFVMLNERLGDHYGIDGVKGVDFRPVPVMASSRRGGLLTQASILKVTANGTTTSPVKRGAWIMSRIVGKPPSPPPPNLPAVEPDIRGASTIREQLAKHRNQESCAACHRNIDPPGFALEAFDVMGAWRDRYRSMGEGEPLKGIGHNGLYYHFKLGLPVDSTGEMPDGEPFADVVQFKLLLIKQQEQLARNMVRQFLIYGTGAGIQFSDRPVIEGILARARSRGYPLRSLLHEVIQSELFLNK